MKPNRTATSLLLWHSTRPVVPPLTAWRPRLFRPDSCRTPATRSGTRRRLASSPGALDVDPHGAGIALVLAAAVLGLAPTGLMAQGRAAERRRRRHRQDSPVLTRTPLRPSFVFADFSVTQGGTPVLPTGANCAASFAGDKAHGIRRYEGRFGRGLVRCGFAFNNARYRGRTLVGELTVFTGKVGSSGGGRSTKRFSSSASGPGNALEKPVGATVKSSGADKPKPAATSQWRGILHLVHVHRRAWTTGMEHVTGPSIDAVARRHEDRSLELGAAGLLGLATYSARSTATRPAPIPPGAPSRIGSRTAPTLFEAERATRPAATRTARRSGRTQRSPFAGTRGGRSGSSASTARDHVASSRRSRATAVGHG